MDNGNYNDYNENYLQPTPLGSVPKAEKKKSKGLIVLKWVGIVLGILVLLVILFLTWFGLETSGTFMRMQDQPKLLRELKEMYDDKSLYVEEYESNSDGIFSVGSFDYTITSRDNPNISFTVEYTDTTFVEDGTNHYLTNAECIYKSSKQSAEKLIDLRESLEEYDMVVYPHIITYRNLNYENEDSHFYQENYVYRIYMGNEREDSESVRLILDSIDELGIDNFYIYLYIYEQEDFNKYLSLKDGAILDVEQEKRGIFKRKEKENPFEFDKEGIISYLNTTDYTLFTEYGKTYIRVDYRDYPVEQFYDGSYLIKPIYNNYIPSTPKIEKTYEEKINDTCHMVIESELGHYFDDKITFYSNPFHIDESIVGDLEYRLYGDNSDSRCQIVIERYFENDGPILDLRSDYAVNFALAEANREIDKLVLKELSDITILPDYISGCVESDDYKSDLVNKEYLRNPIDFQNKYGTDNPIARWLFPEDYDKKQAVKETVEVLEKLGLDRYGVELVFVDDKMKEMLIKDFESFETDESELFSLIQNGNNLYLMKDMDNISINYEDVPLDDTVIKDLDSFISDYVDNSIPYKHKKEMESIMVNENNETIYQNNNDIVNENGEYRFNLD